MYEITTAVSKSKPSAISPKDVSSAELERGFSLLLTLGVISFIGVMNLFLNELMHGQRQFALRQKWKEDLLSQAESMLDQCELSFVSSATHPNFVLSEKQTRLDCCMVKPIKLSGTLSRTNRQGYQVSIAGQLVTHQATQWQPKIRLQSVIEINPQQIHSPRRLSWQEIIDPNWKPKFTGQVDQQTESVWQNLDTCKFYPKSSLAKSKSL